MTLSKTISPLVTPKSVIGLSALLLLLAAVLGILNTHKVKTLRVNIAKADVARDEADRRRVAQQKELKDREASVAAAASKVTERESKAAQVETELAQVQKEKSDLEAKLRANETEIASQQKRVEEAGAKPAENNPGAASTSELQAQLDEARQLLDSAEREKTFLSEKLRSLQDRSVQLQAETKRREKSSTGRLGLHGTVLAVNQAYNFVVLNLGGRQGVEANAEMLVLRGGTLIGKIRISSVEPSTAIGDIITSSLARGVQVQPGDTVIYAGSNS
jgi:flagellar biosynthesis GTPase FlhF